MAPCRCSGAGQQNRNPGGIQRVKNYCKEGGKKKSNVLLPVRDISADVIPQYSLWLQIYRDLQPYIQGPLCFH